MGFLGFGKKKVLDLTTGKYKEESSSPKLGQTKEEKPKKQEAKESSLGNTFSFFDKTPTKTEENQNVNLENDEPFEEKKKKLAKRLLDITTKLEELSNQIYHIQQRLEVLERKAGVG